MKQRSSGVLLHISSLPSEYGIGNFGSGAIRFLDFLQKTSFEVWQLCPLGPTGYGDSPYQCFSAFAGNPYFIDLEPLLADGLLTDDELEALHQLSSTSVEYDRLYQEIPKLLQLAYERFLQSNQPSFQDYGDLELFVRNSPIGWKITPFHGAQGKFGGACWLDWPPAFREYRKVKAKNSTRIYLAKWMRKSSSNTYSLLNSKTTQGSQCPRNRDNG